MPRRPKRKSKRYTFSPEAQDALVRMLDLYLKTGGVKAYEDAKLVIDATDDGK